MARRFSHLIISLVAVLNGTGMAAQAERGGVIFYAGFDGNGDAAGRGNSSVNWRGGAPAFAAGKQGLALEAGDGHGTATYNVAGNVLTKRGSVELWFAPLDWNGDDDKFHVFFEAQQPGWLALYKYYKPEQGLSGVFLVSPDRESWVTAKQDFKDIRPHQWHHLVATWSEGEAKLYLDGNASEPTETPQLPANLTGRFTVGDLASVGSETPPAPRDAHTLIDEFYIYDRPLSNDEVAWAYQHGADRAPGRDLPPAVRRAVRVVPHLDPAADRMQLEVQASGTDQFTGTATLMRDGTVVTAPVTMTGPGEGTATLQYANIDAGDYPVRVDLKDTQGNTIGTTEISASVPGSATWRGNHIGLSTTPPPPWTALQSDGSAGQAAHTISCLGRTYQLGELGLPTQMTSAGLRLLHGPVELDAARGGAPVQWTPGPSRVVASNAVSCISQGTATSVLGTLHWKCTAEFDGMLRYDLELDPNGNASLDHLEVRVPLNRSQAGLQYVLLPPVKNSVWSRGKASATPAGAGVVFKNSWVSYWWLGNEDRGLAGFCESDEAWDRVNRADGFRIERNGDAVEAVWSCLGTRQIINDPWKFTFGLQATPVKPLPADWRRWRISPGGFKSFPIRDKDWLNPANKNVSLIWATNDVMPYYGYPKAGAGLKAKVDQLHALGSKAITYTLINGISAGAPEGQAYKESWGNGVNWGKSKFSDVAAFNAGLQGVQPTRDWADFIAWSCDRFVRANDLDGLYHDLSHLFPATNRATEGGYLRDGKVRPTFPIFAQREVYKRIYTMLKQYGQDTGKETFMLAHASSNMVMPILGFTDATLDGESFGAEGVDDNYLDLISLSGLRAEFIGRNLGSMPFFLPKLNKSHYAVGPTRNLIGLALLHDFQLWPLWSNAAEVNRVYKAVDQFGIANAELLPYWKPGAVGGQTATLKCSAYRRGDGSTLLCVFNTTRSPADAHLTLGDDLFKAGGAHRVEDALDGKPVGGSGGSVSCEVAPLDFRLLVTR